MTFARKLIPIAKAAVMTIALATPAVAAKIERVVSPGGIEAWLVREETVPLISFEFAFRGGSSQDPAGKAGTASMLAALLDEGAGPYDSQAFQRKMEENAVELGFSANRDSFDGSLKMLVEKRKEGFELLRLAVNEARLEQEPIERIREQSLARIRRASTEPGSVAYEAFNAAAFPGHPYGNRSFGSEESVKSVTRADLTDYRARVFARSNLLVSVVGAIDAATLAPLLDEVFGALPKEPRLSPVPEVKLSAVGTTKVINLAVPQTTLVFGRDAIARHDPDYIPAVVMNHILGGGSFTSRLFTEVREKRGLAYSVSSYLDPYEATSVFGGSLATRNDRAADAVALIEAEIKRLEAEGPSASELEKAKKYLMGSYALNFDSSVKIARGLKQIQVQRLPIDYIETRNAQVAAVTAEDVKRAARRILGDGKLFVVAVGQPTGMKAADAAPMGGGTKVPAGTPAKAN